MTHYADPVADRDDTSRRPGARIRDPERARTVILDAALVEFGAHGFAGARTAAIAERAGVSTQLITHHFGGKQGVLDELRRRWKQNLPASSDTPPDFRESLESQMNGVLDNPNWSRLVLWHALEATPGSSDRDDFAGRMSLVVAKMARRQQAGELDAETDPRFAALLCYLVAFAPLAIPDHLRGLTGFDPLSPDYRQWAATQLAALLSRGTGRDEDGDRPPSA